MNRAASIALGLVRGTGVLQVLLGVGIWVGFAKGTNVHMGLGLVFVLSLATLAVLGARAGAGGGFAALAFLWALVTVAFGIAQPQILPGPHHGIIRALHLLVGVVAMGVGDRLGRRIKDAGAHRTARVSVPVS